MRFIPLSALLLAATTAGAQTTFIVRKGADTVAIERFTRDAGTLTGEIIQTNGPRTRYVMTLKPDNSVEHADITRVTQQGATVTISFDIADKKVSATVGAGGQSESDEIVTPLRPLPFLAVSFALSEQIARCVSLPVGQSTQVTAMRLGQADTATATITRFHADSLSISMPNIGVKLALNAKGEVVGGTNQNQPWTVERKP